PPATAVPLPPCSSGSTSPSAADAWTCAPSEHAPPRAPTTLQEASRDRDRFALARAGHRTDRRAAARELRTGGPALAADELRLQPRRRRHPRRALRRAGRRRRPPGLRAAAPLGGRRAAGGGDRARRGIRRDGAARGVRALAPRARPRPAARVRPGLPAPGPRSRCAALRRDRKSVV